VAGRASPSQSSAQPGQAPLPRLVLDPIWSLKQWPVTIEVARQEFVIPAMPAVDWLAVLMDDSFGPERVFPGLLEEDDRAQVEQLLHSGALDIEQLWRLGLDVITQASGRQWYVAMRLVMTAKEAWDALGGDMAAVRSDASLSAWLDILFTLVMRNIEDSKRTMFLLKLEIVPQGWGDEEPKAMEMSADAFLAMAGD
jgi:hypothetical protein